MNIFYINQIGTTNYLLPLFKILKKKKKNFYIFVKKKAYSVDLQNFNYKIVNESYNIFKIYSKILKLRPKNIILSATSDYFEKKLILFAKKNKIKSSSIIDMWVNYKSRFMFENKIFLPDKILCIDKYNYNEMVKLGFSNKKLKIIGNPYLEKFLNYKKSGKKNILFISQPISKRAKYIQKNEFDFYNFIKKFLNLRKFKYRVHLSLHPEEKDKLKILKKYFKDYKLKILFNKKINVDNYSSVCGMFSTELIKYFIIQKKVIIFDLGKNNNWSPLARWKMVDVVKEEKKLYKVLTNKKKFNKTAEKKFLGLKGSLKRLMNYLK